MTAELVSARPWTTVCWLSQLQPGSGVAALVDGEQVAVVRTADGWVYAVGNQDPRSGAMVVSRGIVGSRGDAPTVASPMYKQVFDLRTGRCLDGAGHEPRHLRTWDVRVDGDVVLVAVPRGGRGLAEGGTGRAAEEGVRR